MASRKPAIPGDPEPATTADSPFGDATQEQINTLLAEQLAAARDDIDLLRVRLAQLEQRGASAAAATPPEPELPTYEAALRVARETGRAVLSREGFVMPEAR